MRFLLLAPLVWLAWHTPLAAIEIKWPNVDILVPPLVHTYIVAECDRYEGFSEESVHDCIREERFGYRAVVMMLTDPVLGDTFAERYRDCRVGLGDQGGRFHRRRAECMSCVLRYLWRFEFTRRASIDGEIVIVDAADRVRTMADNPR